MFLINSLKKFLKPLLNGQISLMAASVTSYEVAGFSGRGGSQLW